MRHVHRPRVDVASRYTDIVIGDRRSVDSAGAPPIGRLAGVVVVEGIVYCRWQVGPGRYLVTASSARSVGQELVAKRAAGDEVVLLGVRPDGVRLTDLTAPTNLVSGKKKSKNQRESVQ